MLGNNRHVTDKTVADGLHIPHARNRQRPVIFLPIFTWFWGTTPVI